MLVRLLSLLPPLDGKVWILAVGRFLSETGTGFTLFYASIFFVNQIGLTTTAVGLAIGFSSISGIVGRILGGSFSDSRFWGRRRTLLLSAAISAVGSFVLATTFDFVTLIIGNLISGMGAGLYWPATESVVADITPEQHRREAFAMTRLADNLGLGTGIAVGGILVAATGSYRFLFVIDGASFLIFFVVVYFAIKETYQPQSSSQQQEQKLEPWLNALRDRSLIIFVGVNIIITTYISQLQSSLPIYFKNFVSGEKTSLGFTETIISLLFTWHLVLAIVAQLPVAKLLKKFSHPNSLIVSVSFWALGFTLIWITGASTTGTMYWAAFALAIFAIATVSYTPSASALVTDIAPESQRGVYFSINSLCWAIGYFIGPTLGGWALSNRETANYLWLGLAISTVFTVFILRYLNRIVKRRGVMSE
ncbi:MAG: MDR family MFS transporter [Mastigocoleus sp.]